MASGNDEIRKWLEGLDEKSLEREALRKEVEKEVARQAGTRVRLLRKYKEALPKEVAELKQGALKEITYNKGSGQGMEFEQIKASLSEAHLDIEEIQKELGRVHNEADLLIQRFSEIQNAVEGSTAAESAGALTDAANEAVGEAISKLEEAKNQVEELQKYFNSPT